MHAHLLRTIAFAVVFCSIAAIAAGCSPSGPPRPPEEPFPPETVTLLVTGVDTAEERRSLNKKLGAITDTPGNFRAKMNWGPGKPLTVLLTPVSDPETFAQRIDFGTVEKIEAKTIHVTYASSASSEHE